MSFSIDRFAWRLPLWTFPTTSQWHSVINTYATVAKLLLSSLGDFWLHQTLKLSQNCEHELFNLIAGAVRCGGAFVLEFPLEIRSFFGLWMLVNYYVTINSRLVLNWVTLNILIFSWTFQLANWEPEQCLLSLQSIFFFWSIVKIDFSWLLSSIYNARHLPLHHFILSRPPSNLE